MAKLGLSLFSHLIPQTGSPKAALQVSQRSKIQHLQEPAGHRNELTLLGVRLGGVRTAARSEFILALKGSGSNLVGNVLPAQLLASQGVLRDP